MSPFTEDQGKRQIHLLTGFCGRFLCLTDKHHDQWEQQQRCKGHEANRAKHGLGVWISRLASWHGPDAMRGEGAPRCKFNRAYILWQECFLTESIDFRRIQPFVRIKNLDQFQLI